MNPFLKMLGESYIPTNRSIRQNSLHSGTTCTVDKLGLTKIVQS
jgi:hypothetical protein